MDDMIKNYVNTLMDAFAQYETSSPDLQNEIYNFRQQLNDFSEQNNTIEQFFGSYPTSKLAEQYTSLITKVAMASMISQNENKTPQTTQDTAIISVDKYLDQYRTAYNDACKNNQTLTKAAYEKLFNIANRSEDIVHAQSIIAKENLMWNIVYASALDGLTPALKKIDPLFVATSAKTVGQIKTYKKACCEEELYYLNAIQEVKTTTSITQYTCKMNLVLCITSELIKYMNAKDDIWVWASDISARRGVGAMILHRSNLQKLLYVLDKFFNMSFNDILADETLKIWLLNPQIIDECGKQKRILNVTYLQMMKDIINNEIQSNASVLSALISK